MKKFLFLTTLLFSFGCFAQIVCPQPQDLRSDMMTFFDWSVFSGDESKDDNTGHLFIGQTLFEADNQVWSLNLGLVGEERPRRQAKRLLAKATPATIEYDDENNELCVYLNNQDKKIPEWIFATPAPEIKPCPSLQQMKNIPFTTVEEFCVADKSGCDNYVTMTYLEDRGTNWLLFSFTYKNKATAISETEELKQKAYGPSIDEAMCTYFFGATSEGVKAILAIQSSAVEDVQKVIKKLKYKSIHQYPMGIHDYRGSIKREHRSGTRT